MRRLCALFRVRREGSRLWGELIVNIKKIVMGEGFYKRTVRFPADGFGELATFFKTDITRCCTDESGYGMSVMELKTRCTMSSFSSPPLL